MLLKKFSLLFLMIVVGVALRAQQLTPSDEGSSINFKIKNFGFNTGGSFKGMKGTINFDPQNPSTAHFDVTVDASTVNTGIDARDNHLKEESYFDVKNYPVIHFVSDKVQAKGKDGYEMTGKLTIKKTTKDITIQFTAKPQATGFLFEGSFKINRRDFGVGGSSTIADNLTVDLAVLAKK